MILAVASILSAHNQAIQRTGSRIQFCAYIPLSNLYLLINKRITPAVFQWTEKDQNENRSEHTEDNDDEENEEKHDVIKEQQYEQNEKGECEIEEEETEEEKYETKEDKENGEEYCETAE